MKKLLISAMALALVAVSLAQTSDLFNLGSTTLGTVIAADSDTKSATLKSGILLEDFDTEVPLHEDFYLHVNGKWLTRTEIPADQSNYGVFTVLQEESQKALRKLVEEIASQPNKTPGSDEQKVGDFYSSFTKVDRLEKLGMQPILPLLERVQNVKDKAQLVDLMAMHDRQGVMGPFGVFVQADARSSNQYIVYVTQSGITLPDRDYYLVDEPRYQAMREALKKYVTDLWSAAELADGAKAAERVLDLETRLAKVQWSRVENRDPLKTYNRMTQDELKKVLGNFGWDAFATKTEVSNQDAFVVRQPSFFEGFAKLFDEVPVDVWKDYLRFRVLDAFASALSSKFDDLHFNFYEKTLSGVDEPKPRWRRALDALDGSMGELVGKIYVRENFKPAAKERMSVLVDNLRKAFDVRIQNLEWMSEPTKKEALNKLTKIQTKIGYPDKWKDYTKLEVTPDDLVQNYINVAEFEHWRAIEKLKGPVDRGEWHMNPQAVNAYYNPLGNEIVFPAAILQPPFFNLEADDAVNYGAIGAVIGHEASHAFDDKGSRFDGDGNLRNWWTPEDRTAFEERGKKLVEQYHTYSPIDGMLVNGELTLGENIGDLGGVNVAYTAYKLSLNGKEAPVIDGLTGDQRFFLGYAQIWRRKYRDEELRRRLLTDPHSPSRYRVIGIVSNIDAFYEAFDIKPDQKMYVAPENRVRIW